MSVTDSPLNEQHYQEIQRGLADAEKALRQVNLAKMAGIDVSAAEKQILETQAKLIAVKSVYFPGR